MHQCANQPISAPGDVADGLLLQPVAPVGHPVLQRHQKVVETHTLVVDADQNLPAFEGKGR